MEFLTQAGAFILVLAPLVFIHELGHFLAAKWYRISVPVFSLGFGPRIFGFRRAETDYRVSLVPLGGYVRLAGDEADEERTGAPDEFLSRSKWQRFVVFVMGATFNIILALLLMWVYFASYGVKTEAVGYPLVTQVAAGSTSEQAGIREGDTVVSIAGQDLSDGEYLKVHIREVILAPKTDRDIVIERDGERIELVMNTGSDPVDASGNPGWKLAAPSDGPGLIAEVPEDGPAHQAGIRPGDLLVGIAGEPLTRMAIRERILKSTGESLEFDVEREGKRLVIPIAPRVPVEKDAPHIGVHFDVQGEPYTIAEAAAKSLDFNVQNSTTVFLVLRKLFTGGLHVKALSGPVGIAGAAKQAILNGFDDYLLMLGFFSLQLGILNLLPIPVLDGGHILILLVEGVTRRDLSERVKERALQVGFVFLLAVMSVVIFFDFVKKFA